MKTETITKETIKLDWEQVKELLPNRVSLYYVDYRDSLDEYVEFIQGEPLPITFAKLSFLNESHLI